MKVLCVAGVACGVLTDKGDATEQVRPDVRGFGVYAEYGAETGSEARQRRPVAVRQEIVVLEPNWKMVEMTHRPTYLY